MQLPKYLKLILSLLVPLSVGAVVGITTSDNISTWFVNLKQPWFAPPNWVFGPVWTCLYLLMGYAFYLIWVSSTYSHWKGKAITIFIIQLGLNFLWSYLFFAWHWLGLALFEICLLWVTIFLTILVFAKVSKLAAWLLVPYIIWVSFATILAFVYWQLNTPNW